MKKRITLFMFMVLLVSLTSCNKTELLEEQKDVTSGALSNVVDIEQAALQQAINEGIIQIPENQGYEEQPITTRAISEKSRVKDLNRWMARVDGKKYISELSIPGTHNSGADQGWLGKCQNKSIYNQLNFGVRALDIRCRHINDAFLIHHEAFYQNKTFGDVMLACEVFLRENPTETILMFVKEEYNEADNTRSFEDTFRELYLKQSYGKLFFMENRIPKLEEVRGKIVLLRRFLGSNSLGIRLNPWNNNSTFTIDNGTGYKVRVQDKYVVNNSAWVDWKWKQCKAMLNESLASTDKSTLFINFFNGSGEALLPYGCAEGIMGYWGMNYRHYRYHAIDNPNMHEKRLGVIMQDYISDDYHPGAIAATNYPRHQVISFSSQESNGEGPNNGFAKHAVDGKTNTWWHTPWYNIPSGRNYLPANVVIELDKERTIKGVRFYHRPGTSNGRPQRFSVQYQKGNASITIPTPNWDPIYQSSNAHLGWRKLITEQSGWVQHSFATPITSNAFTITLSTPVGGVPYLFMSEIEFFE